MSQRCDDWTYLVVYECDFLRQALHQEFVLELEILVREYRVVILVYVSRLTVVLCRAEFY